MKKFFAILAILALCCVACTPNENTGNTGPNKLTFENTQWIDITDTAQVPQPEGCTVQVIADFDLAQTGFCVLAYVVVESTNSEISVGTSKIEEVVEYTTTYDKEGNVATLSLGENVTYDVENLGNGRVSLTTIGTDDQELQFIFERIEKPWSLGE